MDSTGAFDVIMMTLETILIACAPVLAIALGVGLIISFIQALTQIQEMTLTFVPKIIAIFGILVFTMPFMYGTLTRLSDTVFDLIVSGGL